MPISELNDLSKLQLNQLLEHLEDVKTLLILTHWNPDPDSIASAFALKYLISQLTSCRARVAYAGSITRMENRAMVDILRLKMVNICSINWKSYHSIALVDHQPRRKMYFWPENRWPDIIIDHHPRRRLEKPVQFIDIRTTFGSNSAILSTYLKESQIKPPRWLATAIAYGILTDTQEFSRGNNDIDRLVYYWLFKLIDHHKLFQIRHPEVDCRYISERWVGMKNARIWGNIAESHIGLITAPDLTAELADNLMGVRNIRYVLTSGYFNGTLYFSLRIRHFRRDAGNLMRKLLSRRGSAGGHGFMAGGQINHLDSEERARLIAESVHSKFVRLIYPENYSKIEPEKIISL